MWQLLEYVVGIGVGGGGGGEGGVSWYPSSK